MGETIITARLRSSSLRCGSLFHDVVKLVIQASQYLCDELVGRWFVKGSFAIWSKASAYCSTFDGLSR